MIKRLLAKLFGLPATSVNSRGYIWNDRYYVFHGHVSHGDCLSYDGSTDRLFVDAFDNGSYLIAVLSLIRRAR